MSKEERDKQSVSQDISDVAEAKHTGELSEQDLAKVDGGILYSIKVVELQDRAKST